MQWKSPTSLTSEDSDDKEHGMATSTPSPNRGYRHDYLWLPTRFIHNLQGVKQSLSFQPQEGASEIRAWREVGDHLLVPREFLSDDQIEDMPFIVEKVPEVSFPKINVGLTYPLRDSVQEGSKTALIGNSGVLSLACGKGKTVIALHAWAEIGVPALVVVPTKDLAYQWRLRISEHTDIQEDEIGWIQGPVDKWDWKDRPIAIAIVHSLANAAEHWPEDMREHFGVVIYDEVHRLGAPYFNRTAAFGHGLRWGLSATPFRKDGLDALYRYHTGDVLYQNLEHENIPEVFFQRTGISLSEDDRRQLTDRTGEINISRLYTWLGENQERNELIKSVLSQACKDGRVSLVLSERVDHLKYLHGEFLENSGLIYGKVKGEQRPNILKDHQIVFAIAQLARDGLDRADLDTVVLTMPFTDRGRFEQIIGRSQRTENPIIVIFEDSIGPCRGMCSRLRTHLTQLRYPFSSVERPRNDTRRETEQT